MVLASLYWTIEATPEENRVVIGRKVLSNIMAYCAGNFGCTYLENFEFLNSAIQVSAKMIALENCNHKLAKKNYYFYVGMLNVTKAQRYTNVRCYFDLSDLSFSDNFSTCPPGGQVFGLSLSLLYVLYQLVSQYPDF